MSDAVTIGSVTVIALSDTEEAYAARRVYPEVRSAEWEPYRDLLGAGGTVLLNFGCYAIRADGRTVLVDTGWGPSHRGQFRTEPLLLARPDALRCGISSVCAEPPNRQEDTLVSCSTGICRVVVMPGMYSEASKISMPTTLPSGAQSTATSSETCCVFNSFGF